MIDTLFRVLIATIVLDVNLHEEDRHVGTGNLRGEILVPEASLVIEMDSNILMEDMEDQSGTVVIQGHSEKVGAGLVVVAAMDLA